MTFDPNPSEWVVHPFVAEDGAFDYATYRAIQIRRNRNRAHRGWIHQGTATGLAKYLTAIVPHPTFGLCHGTRNGNEQRWFRQALPGCDVWGTEISPDAASIPCTIVWDFHEAKPEWVGACDFIYSNSFDHSYDPSKSLAAWMSCLKPDGVCFIDWMCLGTAKPPDHDPFAATLPVLVAFINDLGGNDFGVADVFQTPFNESTVVSYVGRVKHVQHKRIVFKKVGGIKARVATVVIRPRVTQKFQVPPEWATGHLPKMQVPAVGAV